MLNAVYNTWLIHVSITWGTGLYQSMSAHKYTDTRNTDWLSIMTIQGRKFGKKYFFCDCNMSSRSLRYSLYEQISEGKFMTILLFAAYNMRPNTLLVIRPIKATITLKCACLSFRLPWRNSPSRPRPPHYRGFMITFGQVTLGRTHMYKWRRDLYFTTHNIHKRQTSMVSAGFETQSKEARGRRPTP
jgi:hypothetical protein